MTHFWLLNTMNDIDPELVERASGSAARKAQTIQWISAAAAAVVLLASVGAYLALGDWQAPAPIAPGENTTQTTQTTAPTTKDPSGGDGGGIGGDSNACVVHSLLYHSYDPNVVRLVMTDEEFDAYCDTLPDATEADRTYPYQDCNYPESNMVDFIRQFGITREQYIKARGYDKFIEKMGEEAFLNHRYVWGDPTEDETSYELFTYGELLDAIFGENPMLTEWVFTEKVSTTEYEQEYHDSEWQGQYYYTPHDYPYTEPLSVYLRSQELWKERDPYIAYRSGLDEKMINIIDFLTFCGIDRETYISIYGWGDKLDEKAAEHYPNAPYTYRQFVEAIYGDNDILRRWVFGQYVFHPEYPALEEFALLTEKDRFYMPPLMLDEEITPFEGCEEHSAIYHDFYSYFPIEMEREFKATVKNYEQRNIIRFVQFFNLSRTEFMEHIGFFEGEEEEMEVIAENHGVGCPYTYRQFVDALYGDDPALTAWVFANESTWPPAEEDWTESGYLRADEWPPEEYRYKGDTTTPTTKGTTAGRDEFSNTTTRTVP